MDIAFQYGLVGGLLIGCAATLLLALNGRVAGISGITAGLLSLRARPADWAWRVAFVLGLIVGPLAVGAAMPLAPPTFVASLPVLAVAGLLVGFGTVIGNGCTSGHGVCGIARLSMRSILATVTFMLSAGATVYLVRHVL